MGLNHEHWNYATNRGNVPSRFYELTINYGSGLHLILLVWYMLKLPIIVPHLMQNCVAAYNGRKKEKHWTNHCVTRFQRGGVLGISNRLALIVIATWK